MPKSWADRLAAPAVAVVKSAPASLAGMRAGQSMLVPTARMVAEFMTGVPAGTAVDIRTMRRELAERHHAEMTCPIYTGYHLRTVAETALEALAAGVPIYAVTPFWRVLDPTTARLPCGAGFISARRQAESEATKNR